MPYSTSCAPTPARSPPKDHWRTLRAPVWHGEHVQFTADQQYAGPPDAVMALLTDPAFYAQLEGLTKVAPPEVLDRVVDGSTVQMQIRYRFIASLPSAATAILDPARLTWIDDTTYDLAAGSSRTVLRPDHYPDRLQASATTTFVAKPGPSSADPEQTVRAVRGTFKVKVPLVGGKVEKALASGLIEHIAEEAAVAATLLLH